MYQMKDKSQEESLVNALNTMLAQEHACAIRFATHASMLHGPYAETISERLREISQDEWNHATKLRERIVALNGRPTMDIHTQDLVYAHKLEDILKINMDEERDAIKQYTELLSQVSEDNVMLRQTLEDIIKDEQEHLEELHNLMPT